MSWRVDTNGSHLELAEDVVIGATIRLELEGGGGAKVLSYSRDPDQAPEDFLFMLFGDGSAENPGGELGAWLAFYNAPPVAQLEQLGGARIAELLKTATAARGVKLDSAAAVAAVAPAVK